MIYVLDKKFPYYILLGRLWIHPMWCISSNLHRLLKFYHEVQEYVIKVAYDCTKIIGSIKNNIIPYRDIEI